MNLRVWALVLLIVSTTSGAAFAQSAIPSLLGKWDTESIGGMMRHGEGESGVTHWAPGQKTLKGEIDFKTQDGRFVTGVFTSSRGSEQFIAVLSPDGKRLYASDLDGFWDCVFLDADTMELVYRHVKASDSVAAMSTAKRRK